MRFQPGDGPGRESLADQMPELAMVRWIRTNEVAIGALGHIREDLADVRGESPVVGEYDSDILVAEDIPEPGVGILPNWLGVAHGAIPLQALKPWTWTL